MVGANKPPKQFYAFGPFRVDTSERRLMRDDSAVQLTPKQFELLLLFVENGGHMLSKSVLLDRLWPDTFVEETTLARAVSRLRDVLDDGRNGTKYIETVPRQGYRFVAPVSEVYDGDELVVESHTLSRVVIEQEFSAPQTINASPSRASVIARPVASAVSRQKLLAFWTLIIIAAAFILLRSQIAQQKPLQKTESPSFEKMKIAKLTGGKAVDVAISRDGRLAIYAAEEQGRKSLWLKQVATGSSRQITPPANVDYRGLTFSPDGEYVYYIRSGQTDSERTLYRLPMLGGDAEKVLDNVTSPITFSPDGSRFAFVRFDRKGEEDSLVVASLNGGDEKVISSRRNPDFLYSVMYWGGPTWSPDGITIVCTAGTYGKSVGLIEVPAEGGAEKEITAQDWGVIEKVSWLSDGSGLIMSATGHGAGTLQIWQVSYPTGEARRITNDLNSYRSVSVTSDSSALVAVKENILSSIWLVPEADADRAVQLTEGPDDYNGLRGVSCMADGSIVYRSNATGNPNLWKMDRNGENRQQLTFHDGYDVDPSVTPDGRHIVFVSDRAGQWNIWRMDSDGGNPKQLSHLSEEYLPTCTPDGQWVFFNRRVSGQARIWKVSIEGGKAVEVTDKYASFPTLSPDGKQMAFWYKNEKTAVVSSDGSGPMRILPIPVPPMTKLYSIRQVVRWTPDGVALTYINTVNGVSNIWLQPLDGSPARQLTDFKSDQIFFYDWSRDGKDLVCTRGFYTSNVMLITGFK